MNPISIPEPITAIIIVARNLSVMPAIIYFCLFNVLSTVFYFEIGIQKRYLKIFYIYFKYTGSDLVKPVLEVYSLKIG